MKSGVLFVGLMFLFACTNTSKIPQGIIPKQKMEVILWDLIQADRFGALVLMTDSTKKDIDLENMKLYQQVFRTHNVTKEEFKISYKFYLSRPDITKVIFDSIAVKAERQRAGLYRSDTIIRKPSFSKP